MLIWRLAQQSSAFPRGSPSFLLDLTLAESVVPSWNGWQQDLLAVQASGERSTHR